MGFSASLEYFSTSSTGMSPLRIWTLNSTFVLLLSHPVSSKIHPSPAFKLLSSTNALHECRSSNLRHFVPLYVISQLLSPKVRTTGTEVPTGNSGSSLAGISYNKQQIISMNTNRMMIPNLSKSPYNQPFSAFIRQIGYKLISKLFKWKYGLYIWI